MDNECRLRIDAGLAMLDGTPAQLRQLASVLSAAPNVFTISMAVGSLTQVRTDNALLKLTAGKGTLTVEGDNGALGIFYNHLTTVSEDAEIAEDRTIRRHAHVEYLGEGDQWRSPDSFPLVVGADWPIP